MNQYTFTVNGQSVVGNLTWNANGSLGTLVITDPFNSADTQTCNYAHDDMSRLGTVNCTGSIGWSQTFSYDPFGNINKSGTQSFQATYSAATNRMTMIGSSTPTYDNDGNVLNDFLHQYAWDGYGRPTTIDGVTVTYDALGRQAERNNAGYITQVVYAPDGRKIADMNGQTFVYGFFPLPGGAMMQWWASHYAVYRHPDWLGSVRFASDVSRAVVSDVAYGPFGETYGGTGNTPMDSFTGMNQDTVSNLYDFPSREYGIQGRWPSPDPAGLSAVHLKDPQTLNRYAYVRNNPLALTDPMGLDGGDDCIAVAARLRRHGAIRMRPQAADDGGGDCEGTEEGGGDGSDDCSEADCQPTDPNQPDPSQPDPCETDPTCYNSDPSQNQCDTSTCSNVCNTATCQTTTSCDDQGCVNQTTVVVNGNDCDGACISDSAAQILGEVGSMTAPLTRPSSYLCWYGGSVVVGVMGGAGAGGEALQLSKPLIPILPFAFRWLYSQQNGPATGPLQILPKVANSIGDFCNGT